MQTCAVMINRRIVAEVPEWLFTCARGDWPLFLYSATHGPIGFLDRCMAVYRLHSGGVWTGSAPAERIAMAIESNQIIRDNLPLQYHRLMDRRLAWNHASLSFAHSRQGNVTQAREAARHCIALAPSVLVRNPLHAVKMLALAYSPRTAAFARRLMPRESLQAGNLEPK
jgi:hypothetical protein